MKQTGPQGLAQDLFRFLPEHSWDFRKMFDALPVAIYITDAEGRLLYFNPAAVEFSGRVPELGVDAWCVTWKLYYADGTPMPHDACPMAIALKEGRVLRGVEAIAERPDGTRIWFEPYPTPLRDSEGRIIGGINMLMDITDRKQARQERAMLASIVQSSGDAIISKTLEGVITSWNTGAEGMFGYTAEEAIGQSILILIPPELQHEEQEILARLRRGERVNHYDTVRMARDGQRIDISLNISPMRDASGHIIGASKIARDITERKQIESALRASEERFRLMANSTPTIIWTADPTGAITFHNQRWLDYTGTTPEKNAHNRSALVLHPDDLERSVLAWNQASKQCVEYEIEARYRRHDGEYRWFVTRATPLCDADGHIVEWIGSTTDIHDRKQAEQSLRNLNTLLEQRVEERTAELERSNRELDQFAYIASHDLKAPLRAISMLSEWIRQDVGTSLPPASRDHLDKLQQRIKRMDMFLSDLLAYSRAGRQRHVRERVDSTTLVNQIVEMLGFPASFTVTVQEPMPVLETEQVALEIVLANLIGNAFKHHHQPEEGHVWVAAQEQGEWVEFQVSDDGPAIDEQFHQRIFNVFQTLKPRDEVEGSGMGLALVKRLVQMRGGTIAVESSIGHGATFRFTWPKFISS